MRDNALQLAVYSDDDVHTVEMKRFANEQSAA